jgi:hypothetical protein
VRLAFAVETGPAGLGRPERAGDFCASAGAAEGEIVSLSLSGVLGILKKAELGRKAVVGLALYAAGGTAFEFTCGTDTVTVTGSAIHEVKTDAGQSREFFTFVQHKGVQEPEAFEGEAPDVLQSSISGGPAEQAGLTLRALSKNEEKVEVNAFA